ncbi:MAG: hypothetical protein ACPGUH_03240 [Winogradskyella sp.]
MNTNLAPTYKKAFGAYWILWYYTSNSYSVIDSTFKATLDLYFSSKSLEEFNSKLKDLPLYDAIDYKSLANTIDNYLTNCNTVAPPTENLDIDIDPTKNNISKIYAIHNSTIGINFDSEIVMQTVHPAIAHLEVTAPKTKLKIDVQFNIYLKNSKLHLYKNKQLITCVPKEDYHLLQGKFITHIFCSIYNKKESDWIGTFHGSTISDGNSAIMFIGLSGKGKSTLTTLLAAHGLELVSDDVSPLLAENMELYNNPSAISIKKGAFKVLKPLIKDFDTITTVNFLKHKGYIKYVPFSNYTHLHYPCKAIVLVNYQPHSKTALDNANVQDVLETLIPDSWLYHNSDYAKKFLDWLSKLQFYQLTYSNTDEAIKTVKKLFKNR